MNSSYFISILLFALLFTVSVNYFTNANFVNKKQSENQPTNLLRKIRSSDLIEELPSSDKIVDIKVNLSNSTNHGKNISWEEVEENFNMILSEEETLKRWNTMEQKLKSGKLKFLNEFLKRDN